jgi:hypothetical protein
MMQSNIANPENGDAQISSEMAFFLSLLPSAMYYVAGNTVLFTPFDKPICV